MNRLEGAKEFVRNNRKWLVPVAILVALEFALPVILSACGMGTPTINPGNINYVPPTYQNPPHTYPL